MTNPVCHHRAIASQIVIASEGTFFVPERSNLRSRTNAAIAKQSPSSCTQEPIATSLPVHSDERPPRDDKFAFESLSF